MRYAYGTPITSIGIDLSIKMRVVILAARASMPGNAITLVALVKGKPTAGPIRCLAMLESIGSAAMLPSDI
jgi:hypothetical protein